MLSESAECVSSTEQVSKEIVADDVFGLDTSMAGLEITSEDSNLPTWLHHLECPFNWLPQRFSDVPDEEVIIKDGERIEMDEEFDAAYIFEKSIHLVTLAYEFSHQVGDGEAEAWKQLALCDQLVADEKNKNTTFLENLKGALIHAVQATKAHLLLQSGNISQAKQIAEKIQDVKTMTQREQAAIQAMRARFFYHYRSQGAELAVQYAKHAHRLDPNEPLWQLIIAEAIRRHRKFLLGTNQVSVEELSLLKSAVSKQRNAKHLVLLAEAYRECGDYKFKLDRSKPDFFQSKIFQDINDMQDKAFELYKEALALKPDHAVVNCLCGHGLIKLPAFKSDYRLAEHCLLHALELSPNNPITIHSLGLYYYKGLMEYEKAALFCEKAGKLGNFPASLDMMRMKRLVYGNNYDPIFDFEKLLKQYSNSQTKRHEVLCQMGSYYLFFERSLTKALEYFKILLDEKVESSIIMSHKCIFLNMACKVNLFECIVNEGTLLHESKKIEESEENCLKDVKVFLDDLKSINPELFNIPINKNMIDELHKVSDDINKMYVRKKERRDSGKEKYRNSPNRRRSSGESNTPFTRRHSEGGVNTPWRNSGASSNTSQNKAFRSTRYRQNSFDRFLQNVSNKTSLEKENSAGVNHQCDFYNKYSDFNGINTRRRRSSGHISDVKQNRSRKNDCSQICKTHLADGVPTSVSEHTDEHSNNRGKPFKRTDEYGSLAWQSNTGGPSVSNRHYESRNKKKTNEKPGIENWRTKDDEEVRGQICST